MISIRELADLRRRLTSLNLSATCAEATQDVAAALAARVRDALSIAPGGPHATPWLRSGRLRDSIEAESDVTGAIIGSTDPVALDQELGTKTVPPRPFLGPTTAEHAPGIVEAIGARISDTLRVIGVIRK